MLLFCASKVRLAATFLRRTNIDPDDDPDDKNDPNRVRGSLKHSQQLLHGQAIPLTLRKVNKEHSQSSYGRTRALFFQKIAGVAVISCA